MSDKYFEMVKDIAMAHKKSMASGRYYGYIAGLRKAMEIIENRLQLGIEWISREIVKESQRVREGDV